MCVLRMYMYIYIIYTLICAYCVRIYIYAYVQDIQTVVSTQPSPPSGLQLPIYYCYYYYAPFFPI